MYCAPNLRTRSDHVFGYNSSSRDAFCGGSVTWRDVTITTEPYHNRQAKDRRETLKRRTPRLKSEKESKTRDYRTMFYFASRIVRLASSRLTLLHTIGKLIARVCFYFGLYGWKFDWSVLVSCLWIIQDSFAEAFFWGGSRTMVNVLVCSWMYHCNGVCRGMDGSMVS